MSAGGHIFQELSCTRDCTTLLWSNQDLSHHWTRLWSMSPVHGFNLWVFSQQIILDDSKSYIFIFCAFNLWDHSVCSVKKHLQPTETDMVIQCFVQGQSYKSSVPIHLMLEKMQAMETWCCRHFPQSNLYFTSMIWAIFHQWGQLRSSWMQPFFFQQGCLRWSQPRSPLKSLSHLQAYTLSLWLCFEREELSLMKLS